MKIAVACDHGGLELKETIVNHLHSCGFTVVDFGTDSPASCDYPDFAYPAACAVGRGECDFGIVICRTGIGMSIVANKAHGVRCALCPSVTAAQLTRLHNDANVLALGADLVSRSDAIEIVKTFLTTPFSNEERHQRRIDKISALETGE